MKLHDRWELDEAREEKPVRIGVTVPIGKGAFRLMVKKIKRLFKREN